MYADFFGFKELPFNNTPDPRFFFATPDHEEGLASLIYAVQERKGFVLLTGEVGTGKTLVTRMMLRHFGTRVAFANINHGVQSPIELMQSICTEFELEHQTDASATQLVRTLHDFLLAQFSLNIPIVLVLDEAQNLPIQAFEQLRMIGNLEADDAKLLQIAIVGQPELQRMFLSPKLRQLRQRIFRSYHLPALTHELTERYIRHRLSLVSESEREVFSVDAIARIFQVSHGLPRLINTICDNALLSAYSVERQHIDRTFLESVVSQMMVLGDPLPETGDIPNRQRLPAAVDTTPAATPPSRANVNVNATPPPTPPAASIVRSKAPEDIAAAPVSSAETGQPQLAPEADRMPPRTEASDRKLLAHVERLVCDKITAIKKDVAARVGETVARQASIEQRFVAATRDLTEVKALHAQLESIVETVTATSNRAEATSRTLAQRDTQLRQVASAVNNLIRNLGVLLGRARDSTSEIVAVQRNAVQVQDRLVARMQDAHRLADELTHLSNRITVAAGQVAAARSRAASKPEDGLPVAPSEPDLKRFCRSESAAAQSESHSVEKMLISARESLRDLRQLASANRITHDPRRSGDEVQTESATRLASQVEDLLAIIEPGNAIESEGVTGMACTPS